MNTFIKNPRDVKREWYQADAKDFTLGRMASRIARILVGKQHLDYTPHVDMGDYVVVVNAAQTRTTGRKLQQKKYNRFSGYPGGITSIAMKDVLAKSPEKIIREAVRLMLPKNKLSKPQLRRLKIFSDDSHNYKITQLIK